MAPPKDKTEADAPPQVGEEAAPEAAAGVKRPASAGGDGGTAKKVAADGKKTFKGGCHCGDIRYEIDLDPSDLTASKCNCTFCQKLGVTALSVEKPDADFRLVKPSSRDKLDDYAPNMKSVHRYFCKNDGVHVFGEGYYEWEGNKHDFFSLNLGTLDQPQDGIDLSAVKLKYWDGLHDNWWGGQGEKPWAGGLP